MSRQRRDRDATESTSKTWKNRPASRPTQDADSTESRPPTPSTSEEPDPVKDETTGGSAGEDKKEVKSSTKAAAIVMPAKKILQEFAICPRCHEKRYKPEQAGTTVTCMNCRASVVLR